MKRQGMSLPWSGTREAMVRSVSISAPSAPGAVSSTGLSERRVLSSSGRPACRFLRQVLACAIIQGRPVTIQTVGLNLPRFQSKTCHVVCGDRRRAVGAISFWPWECGLRSCRPQRTRSCFGVPPSASAGRHAAAAPPPPLTPPAAKPAAARTARPCSRCRPSQHRRRPRITARRFRRPAGQLALSARYGSPMPQITGGLHWRIYPAQARPAVASSAAQGRPQPRRRSRCRPATMSSMSASAWRASREGGPAARRPCARYSRFRPAACASKAASATPAFRPGRSGSMLFPGSQFEPGDRRPIAEHVATGDVVLVPEGTYHIVSNYGDGNSVVRSDIRVQAGKLIDIGGQPSRRDHHAQAGEPVRRRGARQYPVVGADARRRRGQGIDRRVSARDPGARASIARSRATTTKRLTSALIPAADLLPPSPDALGGRSSPARRSVRSNSTP